MAFLLCKIKDLHPIHGVLLARMYKKPILDKAFTNIRNKLPLDIMYKIVSQDHAIIYYEAWKFINKVCFLEDAIYHIEPSTLIQVARKFYRYGKTEFNISQYYKELYRGKILPRKPSLDPTFIISQILWLLKVIPYIVGKISR